jgi:hypothetical protein
MTARDSELNRDPELMGDLDAAMQTRKELGETYEREIIDSFLAKVEQRIAGIVDKRVRRQLAERQVVVAGGGRSPHPPSGRGPGPAFALAALSLVLAIPLSAIAAVHTGLPGLLICWGGIVGVNACYAGRDALRRGDDRDDGDLA